MSAYFLILLNFFFFLYVHFLLLLIILPSIAIFSQKGCNLLFLSNTFPFVLILFDLPVLSLPLDFDDSFFFLISFLDMFFSVISAACWSITIPVAQKWTNYFMMLLNVLKIQDTYLLFFPKSKDSALLCMKCAFLTRTGTQKISFWLILAKLGAGMP